jgi:nucleoside-triphosphatase
VGKTTLVMRVLETLRASNPQLNIRGFYTSTVYPAFWTPIRCPFTVVDQQFRRFNVCLFVGEVRESGERVGFEVVTLDGRSGPLASSKVSRSGSACYYAWSHLFFSTVHLDDWNFSNVSVLEKLLDTM